MKKLLLRTICWPLGLVGLAIMVTALPFMAAALWCENNALGAEE